MRRVDPPPIVPTFVPIPVRLIVASDGSVRNVHVIRATDEQRRGIEQAVGQWKFRPPTVDGRGAEIETGLVIEFTPEGHVRYPAGERVSRF